MSFFETATLVLLIWLLYEVRFVSMDIKETRKKWLDESFEYDVKHLGVEKAVRRRAKRLEMTYGRGVWQRVKRICGIV